MRARACRLADAVDEMMQLITMMALVRALLPSATPAPTPAPTVTPALTPAPPTPASEDHAMTGNSRPGQPAADVDPGGQPGTGSRQRRAATLVESATNRHWHHVLTYDSCSNWRTTQAEWRRLGVYPSETATAHTACAQNHGVHGIKFGWIRGRTKAYQWDFDWPSCKSMNEDFATR